MVSLATENDQTSYNSTMANRDITSSPIYPIKWGELYRQGYHYGITHLHHGYLLDIGIFDSIVC